MNHWWRAYNEAVDDPKLILLSDKAHRSWFNLMCVASANNGILPDIKFIAVKLRITPQQASSIIAELVQAELIDRREDGRFEPHNWNGRQYKSDVSTERVKRFRKRERNVSEAFQKRPQTTETETDISEAKASGAEAPPDPSEPERQFFARGKEVLGRNAGGQLVKLKNACGGNIALARSKLELAATKENAGQFIGGVIRAGPQQPFAKPLTAHQRERETARSILDDLDAFATGRSGGSQENLGLLPRDPGERSEGIRGGTGSDIIDLPASGYRSSR